MSDWPLTLTAPGPHVICTAGLESQVGAWTLITASAWTNLSAWPAANRALFFPVILEVPFVPQRAIWENGATVSGNLDIGIYDAGKNRLISLGTTAQSGISVMQAAAFTSPPTLDPGLYFIAMAMDNGTGTVRGDSITNGTAFLPILGVQQMATAFVLPTTVTFASPASAFVPMVTISGNTVG